MTDSALTVNFDISGSGTFNTDYTEVGAASFSATVGTVTFAAGSSTATVTVDPTADTEVEPDETVIFTIASGAGYTIATSSMATGTIANDDTEVSVAVSPLSVLEDGTTNLVYTFTRSGETDSALTVNFGTSGTAEGSDFSADASGSVIIPAGVSSVSVTVNPTADSVVEADETVILTVLGGSGYQVGTSSTATGTIANDDTSTLTLAGVTSSQAEGTGGTVTNFTFSVTLGNAVSGGFAVAFSTNDGTATVSDNDYLDTNGSLSFAGTAGEVQTITVPVVHDAAVEADETFSVALGALTGLLSGVSAGDIQVVGSPQTGTIANDDTEVSVSVTPSSVLEDGATNLVYTFTRSGETDSALTVNFDVSGDATLGSDYTPTGAASFSATVGTVTFAAGSSTATITVDPTADTDVEPDETVILTIAAGAGYTIATPNTATGTIANDDTTVNVAVTPSSVLEDGTTNLVYTFTRSGVTDAALTVNFDVSGDATLGSDYTPTGADSFSVTVGTVTFAAGSATATITVDPTADAAVEADETVILTIAAGAGYTIATPNTATGTIANDDTTVNVAVTPSSVLEDGATNLVYTFTRSGETDAALTVNFGINGSGTFNTDYTQVGAASFSATDGTVTFAPGSATATVVVDPIVDTVVEPNETVILTVASGAGYVVAIPNTATGTIENDDVGAAPDGWNIDFDAIAAGPTQSTAGEDYQSVLPDHIYEPGGGYGWVFDASSAPPSGGGFFNGDIPNNVDAGHMAASESERQEDKLRDGHQGNGPSTFRVELEPDATYAVNVTLGSQSQHNNITLDVNGTPIFTDLDLLPGEYRQSMFDVVVGTDGLIDLEFDSLGGLPFFVVNSLEIRRVSDLEPLSFTGSTTASGAITISGTGPAGSLLTISVDAGSSDQGAIGTDSDGSYAGNQVIVDGSGTFSFTYSPASGAAPGSTVMPTFVATAVDGSARSTATVDVNLPAGGATSQRFDFNTYGNASPTAAGFVGVDALDTNIADGFGWATTPSALDAGFAMGVTTPNLYRDGALSFGTPNTFRIDSGVAEGNVVDVRVYYGSPYFPTPGGTVTVESGTTGTMLPRAAGQFGTLTISGAVVGADGILDVTFAGGWWVAGIDVSNAGNLSSGASLLFEGDVGEGAATLSNHALEEITSAAISRLADAGEDVSGLEDVQIQFTDLDDQNAIGLAGERVILIDDDGFGHGWFVDQTPLVDEEFTATAGTELAAKEGEAVGDQVDLLTVVMHELSHILGYDDLEVDTNPHELMTAEIGLGTRRLPTVGNTRIAASDFNGQADESWTASPTSRIPSSPDAQTGYDANAHDAIFEGLLEIEAVDTWDVFDTPSL